MPAEYEPYGVDWESDLMKWRKCEIIGLLRQVLIKEEKFTSHNSQSDAITLLNKVYQDLGDCGAVKPDTYSSIINMISIAQLHAFVKPLV